MSYWRFPFENELPINCFLTQWKWTYILDLEPWKWNALNMDYMDKRLSRMQRQFYFLKTDETDNNFRLGFEKHRFFCEGYPKVPDRGAAAPIHLPWNFVGKIVSVTQCAPGLGKTWNNIKLIYLNMSVTLKPTAEQLCTHIECEFPQITDTLAGVRATVEGGFQKHR